MRGRGGSGRGIKSTGGRAVKDIFLLAGMEVAFYLLLELEGVW